MAILTRGPTQHHRTRTEEQLTYIPTLEQQQQLRERLAVYLTRCSPTFRHALLRHPYGGEQIYYLTIQRAKHLPVPEHAPPHAQLAFAQELTILVMAAQLLVGLARTEEWQHLVLVAQRDHWDLDRAFQSAHVLLAHAALHPENGSPLTRSGENKRLIAPLFGYTYLAEKRRYVGQPSSASTTAPAEEGTDAKS